MTCIHEPATRTRSKHGRVDNKETEKADGNNLKQYNNVYNVQLSSVFPNKQVHDVVTTRIYPNLKMKKVILSKTKTWRLLSTPVNE